jgi:hypothetical protein
MGWIDVVHDRAQWRVLVNTIMYLRVPLSVEKFMSGMHNWQLLKVGRVSHKVS